MGTGQGEAHTARCSNAAFMFLNKELIVHSDYLWGVGVKGTFSFVVYVLQYSLNFYKEHTFLSLKKVFPL